MLEFSELSKPNKKELATFIMGLQSYSQNLGHTAKHLVKDLISPRTYHLQKNGYLKIGVPPALRLSKLSLNSCRQPLGSCGRWGKGVGERCVEKEAMSCSVATP